MKLNLKKQYINGAVALMQKIPLVGYQSMARTRFIRVMKEPVNDLLDDQKALLDEYALKDDNGEFVVAANKYQFEGDNEDKYTKAYSKLLGETAEIEKGTYTDHKKDMQDVLKNCTLQLSGDEATVYAALCDALDVFEEKEGK